MREMKDSGITWVDSIPTGWKRIAFWQAIERIGTGLNPRDNFTLGEGENYYVTIKNFKNGKLFLDENCDKINDEALRIIQERSQLQKDDILLASISSDGQTYIVGKKPTNWNINESVFCIRVKKDLFTPEFFCYQLTNCALYADLQADATGATFQSIKQNRLLKEMLVLPSKEEQSRIADYLDKKCAEIDALIAAKEKTNALLKERRQSIIYEAVTKGLDPTAPMKDSGIEWIGKIPKGWGTIKLKFLLTKQKGAIKAGPFGSALNATDMRDSFMKVFTQRTVLDWNFISGDEYVSEEKSIELSSFIAKEGDVLITTRGSIGKTAIVPQGHEGILHPCLIKMAFDNSKVSKKLICRIFNETDILQNQLRQMSNATTIDVIYTQNLLDIVLPLIPMNQQLAIEYYLQDTCSKIDSIIKANESTIEKLKEYRQSVIYEAVTGKVEV